MDFFFTLATPSVTPTGPTLGVGVPKALPQVLSPLIEGSLPTTVQAGSSDRTITATGTQTEQSYYWGRFSSLPLAAQTIAANTWTISGFNGDQDGNSNTAHWPVLYVWRPSTGAMVGAVFPGALGGSEWFANQGTQSFSLPGGQAVTCQDGDILVYEYWAYGTQGMTTGAYVQRVRFNDAVAWLRTPQTLTFYSGPAGPVGTLNVTEDPDTLAATGTVVNPPAITGTLNVTEAADTLAATGTAPPPPITGTAGVTEAADTLAGTGTVAWTPITGTAGITEGADTLAAAGTVVAPPARTGTVAVTEGPDTLAATGTVANPTPITGTAGITEAADTVAASGLVVNPPGRTGTVAVTEAPDTVSSTGTVAWTPITGTAAITEASDTVAAAGTVVNPPAITGTAAITEGADTLSASGTVAAIGSITGTAAITEASDTLAGTGTVVWAPITGTLGVTEEPDTVSASGTVTAAGGITGTLAITEAPDTVASSGTVANPAGITGTVGVTEAADTLAATGTVVVVGGITGAVGVTEAPDTVAATGTVVNPAGITGTAGITEAADTVAATGTVVAPPARTGTLAVTEAPDTLAATGKAGTAGTVAQTEQADTLAATGTVAWAPITGTLNVTEAPDTLAATGTVTTPEGRGRIVELGELDTFAGTFEMETALARARFAVRGLGAAADVDFGPVVAPVSKVLTGQTDLAGPIIIGRADGVQTDTDTSPLGGTFGSFPIHVGGGAPVRLYSLIVRASTVASTNTEVTDTERYVAGKTGLVLPFTQDAAMMTGPPGAFLMLIMIMFLMTMMMAGCAMILGGCAMDTVQGRAACEPGGAMILIDSDLFVPPQIVINKGGSI